MDTNEFIKVVNSFCQLTGVAPYSLDLIKTTQRGLEAKSFGLGKVRHALDMMASSGKAFRNLYGGIVFYSKDYTAFGEDAIKSHKSTIWDYEKRKHVDSNSPDGKMVLNTQYRKFEYRGISSYFKKDWSQEDAEKVLKNKLYEVLVDKYCEKHPKLLSPNEYKDLHEQFLIQAGLKEFVKENNPEDDFEKAVFDNSMVDV